MLALNRFYFNKIAILNYLISTIPFSLIVGNLLTNINIFLICVLGFYIFGKKIFIIKNKFNYLIYFFFLYLIFITIFNNYSHFNENKLYLSHILKSFFYLRFLIVFLILSTLIEEKKFNTQMFFISCSFFSLIVAIDIVIQFFFKYNILGYPLINNKPSSFFKFEHIAGGYLQKFLLFFIFLFAAKKYKKINSSYLIILLSLILLIPIIFTANRMPALLFAASVVLYFLIEKKFKQLFIVTLIFTSILFMLTKIHISERLHVDLKIFFSDSFKIINNAPRLFISNELKENYIWHSGYLIHFNSGVQQWKKNKIFGHGLKSFRLNCSYGNNQTCNTHPHNYLIELMVDTGIIGVFLFYFFLIFAFKNFLNFYLKEKNIKTKLTLVIFPILIFFEFIPIRSSGSFFTTSNSIFIFLILAMFINFKKIEKL